MPGTIAKTLDFVLLGATGHTGVRTAEYITQHFPTTLRWAVAGRSYEKLRDLVENLKKINPDRKIPEILPIRMTPEELRILACKTKIIINLVGPYALYSTPIVEACAKNGTHYLDITGEVSWIKEMIDKYDETAKSTNAILISAVGMDSAPPDILSYLVTRALHARHAVHPKRITSSIYSISSTPSGGTTTSLLNELPRLEPTVFTNSTSPYRLSANPPASPPPRTESYWESLSGTRAVPGLGTLTTYAMAVCDEAVVNRSISLRPDVYGLLPRFSQHLRVPNAVVGACVHWGLVAGSFALRLPLVRALARKCLYAPGEGASREKSAGEHAEVRAVAVGEVQDAQGETKEVSTLGRFRYDGDLYYMTGVIVTEAARTLLEEEELVKELKGGYLTPAMLGDAFAERLRKGGCILEVEGEEN